MVKQHGSIEGVDGSAPRLTRETRSAPSMGSLDATAMSHELRTPLNAIQGNLGLLLDGALGPLSRDARACLADMQQAARRLLSWIDDLLTEIDRAAPTSHAERHLDLVDLVRDVLGAAAHDLLELRPCDARLTLGGPVLWLDATAMAIAQLHEAISPGRPLVLALPPGAAAAPELWVTWPSFDRQQIRGPKLPLLTAIMELQGGRLVSGDDGLRLYWPPERRPQSAGSGAAPGRSAASSSLAGG